MAEQRAKLAGMTPKDRRRTTTNPEHSVALCTEYHRSTQGFPSFVHLAKSADRPLTTSDDLHRTPWATDRVRPLCALLPGGCCRRRGRYFALNGPSW
jgi:hypothetical protein